jgi:hypothetical protein
MFHFYVHFTTAFDIARSRKYKLQQQINSEIEMGAQQIPELRVWFREEQLQKIQCSRDASLLRLWLRNVRAGRKRDLLRRGSDREIGRMQAIMQSFLQGNTT